MGWVIGFMLFAVVLAIGILAAVAMTVGDHHVNVGEMLASRTAARKSTSRTRQDAGPSRDVFLAS